MSDDPVTLEATVIALQEEIHSLEQSSTFCARVMQDLREQITILRAHNDTLRKRITSLEHRLGTMRQP